MQNGQPLPTTDQIRVPIGVSSNTRREVWLVGEPPNNRSLEAICRALSSRSLGTQSGRQSQTLERCRRENVRLSVTEPTETSADMIGFRYSTAPISKRCASAAAVPPKCPTYSRSCSGKWGPITARDVKLIPKKGNRKRICTWVPTARYVALQNQDGALFLAVGYPLPLLVTLVVGTSDLFAIVGRALEATIRQASYLVVNRVFRKRWAAVLMGRLDESFAAAAAANRPELTCFDD
jgi:hypothetical protein